MTPARAGPVNLSFVLVSPVIYSYQVGPGERSYGPRDDMSTQEFGCGGKTYRKTSRTMHWMYDSEGLSAKSGRRAVPTTRSISA